MSNLLLTRHGTLKIADFGMAREKAGWMTPQPVTIWYRAPELLFGSQRYSFPVDLWSAGCIVAELITSQPLLPGANEREEMDLIVALIGLPSETTWPGFKRLPWANKYAVPENIKQQQRRREGLKAMFQAEKQGLVEILTDLIMYNPEARLTAREALDHRYFREAPAGEEHTICVIWCKSRTDTVKHKMRRSCLHSQRCGTRQRSVRDKRGTSIVYCSSMKMK